ncbi:MAG: hypothetical protein FWG35_04575 [Spirochaetaceae bacterium]|nr:hypothetical protein [Spirochaetaceae bacterium]
MLKITAFCVLSFCLGSCASLVEKAGRALDGSAFAEEELALYRLAWADGFTDEEGDEPDREESGAVDVRLLRARDGSETLAIYPGVFPGLRINATPPDSRGSVQLMTLDFFCSNITGWNEFTLEIIGVGTFRASGGGAFLRLELPVEAGGIVAGKIRRMETRLTGEEALSALRNRQERITSLCAWMRGQEGVPPLRTIAEFGAYWQPRVLPEMVSPRERSATVWTEEGAVWARAEDISWNTSYTQKIFPEELWKVRDSGTLLRDWEEALDWIYFMYRWEDLFAFLATDIDLEGVR